MKLVFPFLALLTLLSAVGAMTLRNLVHCALCAAVSFVGIAALFLQLDAEFVGFAQVLIYVGAVAVLVVFAILLTRHIETANQPIATASWVLGLGVALLVTGALVFSVANSVGLRREPSARPPAAVRLVGQQLMTRYVVPLQVAGLLLTATLVGAVLLAAREKGEHE